MPGPTGTRAKRALTETEKWAVAMAQAGCTAMEAARWLGMKTGGARATLWRASERTGEPYEYLRVKPGRKTGPRIEAIDEDCSDQGPPHCPRCYLRMFNGSCDFCLPDVTGFMYGPSRAAEMQGNGADVYGASHEFRKVKLPKDATTWGRQGKAPSLRKNVLSDPKRVIAPWQAPHYSAPVRRGTQRTVLK